MITCQQCQYWVRSDLPNAEDEGECRRNAPSPCVGFDPGDGSNWAWWPVTLDKDGCSQGAITLEALEAASRDAYLKAVAG